MARGVYSPTGSSYPSVLVTHNNRASSVSSRGGWTLSGSWNCLGVDTPLFPVITSSGLISNTILSLKSLLLTLNTLRSIEFTMCRLWCTTLTVCLKMITKIRKYSSSFTALQPGFNTFGDNVSWGSVPLQLDFSRSRYLVFLGRCWSFLSSWILPHSSQDRFPIFNFVTLQVFRTDNYAAWQHNVSSISGL